MSRKFIILIICGLLLYLSWLSPAMEDEFFLKSFFFEKFARFIKWPKEKEDASRTFVIGVLGGNPFGKILENVYVSSRAIINGKLVEIKYFPGLEDITDCHILYISSDCSSYLNDVLAATKDKPILTVGDTAGFAEKGVLMNMYVTENKIRFEVNRAVLQDSMLKFDSRLLRMAKIVKSRGEGG